VAVQAESRTPERLLSPREDADAQHAAPSKNGIDAAGRPPIPRPAGAQASGALKLNIKPWGAVYVDGVAKGVSPPLKKLVLPEGHHQIQIMNPNFPSHTIQIEISNKKTGSIEHDFSSLKK
jgi:hypothetical protein